MFSSVTRLVRLGTTLVGPGAVRVNAKLKMDTLMDLSACKL